MQPTRSVGGIPSGDWMTEFPTVVRLLNGFMEGLARGRGGISEDTKAGGREDDWKCEKFSLNVAGRGWREAEFSHWSCKFHRIFPASLLLYHVYFPHLLKRYYEYSLCLRARDRTWLPRLKLLARFPLLSPTSHVCRRR